MAHTELKTLNEMQTAFAGYYILKDAAAKTTSTGKPYLAGTLMDKSGTIEFKLWDYTGSITDADAGKVVYISGKSDKYKDLAQVIVSSIRLTEADEAVDLSELVPVAPIDRKEELVGIKKLLASIEDADYKAVCAELFKQNFEMLSKLPAAKSVHHNFIGGLLMHTASMMRTANFLADNYKGLVNKSLLLAGTFCHDLAKEKEFTVSELGLVSDYSLSGNLLGHLVMGAQNIKAVCEKLGTPEEKSVLLQHLILSHHGQPEYGAAVIPMCAEAELLFHIDMMDSRMEIYREAKEAAKEPGMQEKIPALGKRVYFSEIG